MESDDGKRSQANASYCHDEDGLYFSASGAAHGVRSSSTVINWTRLIGIREILNQLQTRLGKVEDGVKGCTTEMKSLKLDVVSGGDRITRAIQSSTIGIRTNASRLLAICTGIRTDIHRIDGRQVQMQSQLREHRHNLMRYHRENIASIQSLKTSLHGFILNSTLAVGRLLKS
jgi:hypothetical protein